jgi:uncharacterized protein YukE
MKRVPGELNYNLLKLKALVSELKKEKRRMESAQRNIADEDKNIIGSFKGGTSLAYSKKSDSNHKKIKKQIECLDDLITQCSDAKDKVFSIETLISERIGTK